MQKFHYIKFFFSFCKFFKSLISKSKCIYSYVQLIQYLYSLRFKKNIFSYSKTIYSKEKGGANALDTWKYILYFQLDLNTCKGIVKVTYDWQQRSICEVCNQTKITLPWIMCLFVIHVAVPGIFRLVFNEYLQNFFSESTTYYKWLNYCRGLFYII